jgi:uncharacterized protein
MGRNKKIRLIQMAPTFAGYIPRGPQNNPGNDVIISFEEYEALNLCDYDLLTQSEAAKLMKISRPTFTRIYESVRRKIAKAFVDGSPISFEIGTNTASQWLTCSKCQIRFDADDSRNICCPLCNSEVEKPKLQI